MPQWSEQPGEPDSSAGGGEKHGERPFGGRVFGAGDFLVHVTQRGRPGVPFVAEVRYPKKIRELAKLEAAAVEVLAYGNSSVRGLLQMAEYARSLFSMRQPAYPQEEIERGVAARMARQTIFERSPAPTLGFVLEEVVLRRPLGGRMVLRRQLEHLLVMNKLRNVTVQVMPMDREEHAGIDGEIQVLKFRDGRAVGRSEGAFAGRPVSDPKQVRILDLRCGMIRAQALTPPESTAFIERVLGET
ncbi:DUF5753 domain-containing protein [Streptomyces griseus]|uniref:DUF5753 domain-containing protein n=1 Tax=Streptomyces griseus TaxID=1911 RepID=UPI00373AE93A